MTTATLDLTTEDTVRMTLLNDEYLAEHGGRLKAGTVVLVDQRTARRWHDKSIAVPSAETDKTVREQKLAELARIKAEIEALEQTEPVAPITRPGGVPARERR